MFGVDDAIERYERLILGVVRERQARRMADNLMKAN